MMKFEYIITYGHKYRISSFKGHKPLKLDHKDVLYGKVYYNSKKTLRIETTLSYDVGQKISIGGYPIGGKKFRLIEVSITNNPVLANAEVISRKEIQDDN